MSTRPNDGDHNSEPTSRDLVAISSEAKSSLDRFLLEVRARPTAQQACVGGGAGWCAGYLFAKVGKVAAITLGGSVLLLQVANNRGYVSVNWNRVADIRQEVTQEAEEKLPWLVEQVKAYFRQNRVFAGSFAGGFLVGLAMS